MNCRHRIFKRFVQWLAPIFVVVWAAAGMAAVRVALVPGTTNVAPGAAFEVRLEVTQAAEAFNAFDATVAFDPAALTFLQASPLTLQEGDLMTSTCSNRFHVFRVNPIRITDAFLCPEAQVSGPGTLYVLRFQAADVAQQTVIQLSALQFYLFGPTVPVSPVSPLTITIGSPSDVPPAELSVVPRLRAWPNPFNPTTTIGVETTVAGPERLAVYDARGRLIRILQSGSFACGTRTVSFDGLDQTGATLSAGVYTVVLQAGSVHSAHRIVLLK